MTFAKSLSGAAMALLALLATTLLAMASPSPAGKAGATSFGELRYIETRSTKKHRHKARHKARHHRRRKKENKKIVTIAQIRDGAIRDTISGLRELRPYTHNYNGLKAAVRRYWKRNVRHPSAHGLASTIMRYVKRSARADVRSEVYSGSKSGVNKVKKQLRKNRG